MSTYNPLLNDLSEADRAAMSARLVSYLHDVAKFCDAANDLLCALEALHRDLAANPYAQRVLLESAREGLAGLLGGIIVAVRDFQTPPTNGLN